MDAFLEMPTHLPTNRKLLIPDFVLLARTTFVLAIKLSLSLPMSFPILTLLIHSPISCEGSTEGAAWC